MNSRSKRVYLRAPVNDELLYLCDDYVLKGVCSNISEGGVLLSHLGRVPTKNEFAVLVPLIQYPDFSKLSTQKIMGIERSSFEIEIIRARVNVVRSFEGKSEVEKILMKNIGASFINLDAKELLLIQGFVSSFAKNIVYLLTLFQNHQGKNVNIPYIRKVASLLGYDGGAKFPVLRQQVLHDYQSLESV